VTKSCKRISSSDINVKEATHWIKIFNFDETGIYHKSIHQRTYILNAEKHLGIETIRLLNANSTKGQPYNS
jgi:hypothetical protein